MPRVVIVATGPDLDSLPAEVQDVANAFSTGGWTVRLCIGQGASRAGLDDAAAEGPARLAWIGAHADERGFGLDSDVIAPADLGLWLAQLRSSECVLNACYSLEHVTAIQRVAACGVACTIDPQGVGDDLAWTTGVAIARARVELGDLAAAVRAATGDGVVAYRYIPYGGRGVGAMTEQQDQLSERVDALVRALNGEWGQAGLLSDLRAIRQEFAEFRRENTEWRLRIEQDLQSQRAAIQRLQERSPISLSTRGMIVLLVIVVAIIVGYGLLITRLAGV